MCSSHPRPINYRSRGFYGSASVFLCIYKQNDNTLFEYKNGLTLGIISLNIPLNWGTVSHIEEDEIYLFIQ